MSAARTLRGALGPALALVIASAVVAAAAEPAWLVGRWELVRDPDGNPKDFLEFSADGQVASIKLDGQRFTGRYVVSDSSVRLNFQIGARSVVIDLAPAADRKQLYTRSAQTGKIAVYGKLP